MKRMIVRIPASFALSLLTTGRIDNQATRVEIPGLPADARHIGAWHHHPSDSFDIVVEHDSFEETLPGCEHRRLEVRFVHVDADHASRVFAKELEKALEDRGFYLGRAPDDPNAGGDRLLHPSEVTECVRVALEALRR